LQRRADMAEHIHTFHRPLTQHGLAWTVEAWGEEREGGRWEGWIVFGPVDGGPLLATGRETTQSHRAALEYWAGGLEEIYLDGAFARAVSRAA